MNGLAGPNCGTGFQVAAEASCRRGLTAACQGSLP